MLSDVMLDIPNISCGKGRRQRKKSSRKIFTWLLSPCTTLWQVPRDVAGVKAATQEVVDAAEDAGAFHLMIATIASSAERSDTGDATARRL